MNEIERRVRAAKNPVALTGAGISAPSGIPTFQGEWRGKPIRDFLSRAYFESHPRTFFELFCEMAAWCHKSPNAAHRALALWGLPIITQNIDGLHHKADAGGKIIELHGSLRKVVCRRCGAEERAERFAEQFQKALKTGDPEEIRRAMRCPCGKRWDTDVVLYGDAVRDLDLATDYASTCDLMLVVGTSLTTYPAAILPEIAAEKGAEV